MTGHTMWSRFFIVVLFVVLPSTIALIPNDALAQEQEKKEETAEPQRPPGVLLAPDRGEEEGAGPIDHLIIRGVTIINGVSDRPIEDATVVVVGGKISVVGPSSEIIISDGAEIIDGTGRFLIPGLWDTHAHLSYWGEDALEMLVITGVTSIRELGGDADLIEKWKNEIASGVRLGPSMIWCGPYVEGANAPDEYRVKVSTEAEARSAVRSLLDRGADFIKIQAQIEPHLVTALVDEAGKTGHSVVGHVPAGLSAVEASELGLHSIEHMSPYVRLTDEEIGEVIETFLRNDTWLSPALFSMVAPVQARGEDPDLDERIQRAFEIVKRAHDAGVPILVGANFAYRNWPQQPGSGLHGEMHSLVDAGITPMDVIKLATSRAAEFAGQGDRNGVIRAGYEADMVLLDADPLIDIRNTERIAAVIMGGRVISPN